MVFEDFFKNLKNLFKKTDNVSKEERLKLINKIIEQKDLINFPEEVIPQIINTEYQTIFHSNLNVVIGKGIHISTLQLELLKRYSLSSYKSAQTSTRNSLIIAVISIILSGCAIFLSYQCYKSSNDWQSQQIPVLENITNEVVSIKNIINKPENKPNNNLKK